MINTDSNYKQYFGRNKIRAKENKESQISDEECLKNRKRVSKQISKYKLTLYNSHVSQRKSVIVNSTFL